MPVTVTEWSQALAPIATLIVAIIAVAIGLRDSRWRRQDSLNQARRSANQVVGSLAIAFAENQSTNNLEVVVPYLDLVNHSGEALRATTVDVIDQDSPDIIYASAQREYIDPAATERIILSPRTPIAAKRSEQLGMPLIPAVNFDWRMRWRDAGGMWWEVVGNSSPQEATPPGRRWAQFGGVINFKEIPSDFKSPAEYRAPEN